MANISLWEAMDRIGQLNPRWSYEDKYGYGHLSFETTCAEGYVSVLLQKGFSGGGSSPITYRDAFWLTITVNGRRIFDEIYKIEYHSGFFGGPEKPHSSREYRYLIDFIAPFETEAQARGDEVRRKEREAREAEERKTLTQRERFFGK